MLLIHNVFLSSVKKNNTFCLLWMFTLSQGLQNPPVNSSGLNFLNPNNYVYYTLHPNRYGNSRFDSCSMQHHQARRNR